MKRKNGFTLVELLAVIVVLATIISLATGSIISILNKSREKLAEEVRHNFAEVAVSYVTENIVLEKCSVRFSEKLANNELDAAMLNSEENKSCYTKVTVQMVKNEKGMFEDARGFCSDTDTIIVYRYNDDLGNSEYKSFISDTICRN